MRPQSLSSAIHRMLGHFERQKIHASTQLLRTLSYRFNTSESRSKSIQQVTTLQLPTQSIGKFCHGSLGQINRRISTVPDVAVDLVKDAAINLSPKSTVESALYLRHSDNRNITTVSVDLDLEMRFDDVALLENDLRRRGHEADIDIEQLVNRFKEFSKMQREESRIEEERKRVSSEIQVWVKRKKKHSEFEAMREALVTEGKNLREELKLLHAEMWDVEADVMLSALQLPTPLSRSTPDEDEILEEIGTMPADTTAKSHIEIGHDCNYFTPSNVSTGAVYLHGLAARLELETVDAMSRALRKAELTQFSCPDMTKAVVLEGCGRDFTDPTETLTIQQKAADILERGVSKVDLLLGLGGGASLPAFASYLCRMNVSYSSLPLRWFSVGRNYTPTVHNAVQGSCLLDAMQATQVAVFGAGRTSDDAEDLYDDYVSILWTLYSKLAIPIRQVQVGAKGLLRSQSAATRIEAWLPSEQRYITVADVGVFDDFISRRLMSKWTEDIEQNSNRNYLHMVYGTALDFPRLLAVLLENSPFPRKSLFGAEMSG